MSHSESVETRAEPVRREVEAQFGVLEGTPDAQAQMDALFPDVSNVGEAEEQKTAGAEGVEAAEAAEVDAAESGEAAKSDENV